MKKLRSRRKKARNAAKPANPSDPGGKTRTAQLKRRKMKMEAVQEYAPPHLTRPH